jgi:hypothetical protein
MTIDLTTLPAGRELDAIVAERVMGWVPGAGFSADTYWAFSTDIAEAWKVVGAMNLRHAMRFPEFLSALQDIALDDPAMWRSSLAWFFAHPSTAPLHICRAALAAVGDL